MKNKTLYFAGLIILLNIPLGSARADNTDGVTQQGRADNELAKAGKLLDEDDDRPCADENLGETRINPKTGFFQVCAPTHRPLQPASPVSTQR